MQMVILDGHTLNPGDLDWQPLTSLADCQIYDRTPESQIIERAGGAEIILTNKTPLNAETVAQLPKLKYIGVLATGYNIVDINAAKARGIVVANVPAYSTMSVAQVTFALLLELTHHVGLHSQSVRSGDWASCVDFSYAKTPLIELAGRTMGLIGLGQVGQAVAIIAQAMGMRVIGFSRSGPPSGSGIESAGDIDTIFRQADVVSLHCPLTPDTQQLVNTRRLALMKRDSFLINTSRGSLVDEQALTDALNTGQIAGAGLDVLSTEPPKPDNPLLAAQNCVITPPIAWASNAARTRLLAIAADNVRAFLTGRPTNVVA